MTVAFNSAMGCNAPQFGFAGSRRRPEVAGQDDFAPAQEQPQDLRSQRLWGGAKMLGIATLMGLVTHVGASVLSEKTLLSICESKWGMGALAVYGLVSSVLGIAGMVQMGRGLFTKAGQTADQPQPVAE